MNNTQPHERVQAALATAIGTVALWFYWGDQGILDVPVAILAIGPAALVGFTRFLFEDGESYTMAVLIIMFACYLVLGP